MSDATFELAENIFERILTSSHIDFEELDHLEDCIDQKLIEVEERLQNEERKLEIEIESLKVSTTDHVCNFDSLALQCFLNNVLQAIERNPGFEDYILKDVLEFCFDNGVAFPLSHENMEENLALHTIADKNEEESYLLWKKICQQLKTGILNLIKNAISLSNSNEDISKVALQNYRQIYLFELLLSIFTFETVFKSYCKLRLGMSRSEELSPAEVLDEEFSMKIKTSIVVFQNIIQKQLKIMHEDCILLRHFCSDEQFLTSFQILLEMYEENVSLYIHTFLDFYNKVSYKNINFNSIATETKVELPTFSTEDLQNFSQVFCILFHWSQSLKTLINNVLEHIELKKGSFKEKPFVVEDGLDVMNFQNILKWKKQFVPYLPLLKKVIPSYVNCVCNVVIDSHRKEISESGECELTFAAEQFQNDPSCPQKITNHCSAMLSLIDKIIIFAAVDDDKQSLKELHEVITLVLIDAFNIHCNFLDEMLKDSKNKIKIMYQILADTSLICYQLQTWDNTISESSQRRGILKLTCSNYLSVKEECISSIINYHIKTIKSTIVFDNHGNNWIDDKPFFEGERCSYTVQMWNYYIRGVVYDFRTILPKKQSTSMLKEICTDILSYFTSYYSKAQTSYRRVKQLKADIQVILSSFRWLLLYVSEDIEEILNIEKTGLHHWHMYCCQLYEIMIITNASLSQVYDHLKNGEDVDDEVLWFDQIGSYKYSNFPNVLALERVCVNPLTDWETVEKLMIHNNAELPLLLMKHSSSLQEPILPENATKKSLCEVTFVQDKDQQAVVYKSIKKDKLCSELYKVIRRSSRKAFFHFMACLISEDDSKSFKISSANQELPLWLELIAKDLHPVFKRILNPALKLLLAECKYKAAPTFKFNKLQTLPCGCPTSLRTEKERFLSGSELLHKCLMETLSCLTDSMPLLPKHIWEVLSYVKTQPQFSQSWIKTPNLGTKILACLLYNWLVTKENIPSIGIDIPQYTLDNISAFAELLWHVIYNLTYDVAENPNISMDIYKNLRKSGESISKALNTFHFYFDGSALNFKSDENLVADFTLSKKLDQDEIADLQSLKYLHGILKTNQITLMKLSQKPDSEINVTDNRQFTAHYQMTNKFHCLHQFKLSGHGYMDHFELLEGLMDWGELIPHVALPKWRAFLGNRFEFQKSFEGVLNETEKEEVRSIKEVFGEKEDNEENGNKEEDEQECENNKQETNQDEVDEDENTI